MIRFLTWLFGIEALMRRLDRRPPPAAIAKLPPIHTSGLALHMHDASTRQEPAPIGRSPFV